MADHENDEIKDLDPTDHDGHTEQPDAAAEATATAQPDSAKSSDAQDATEDDSSLSIVREAGAKKEEPVEGASSAQVEDGQQAVAQSTRKEQDNENFSDVPFHKHPRFQQVLGRMKAAEGDAQHYQTVQRFIDNAGLDATEAANALVIAGQMKTDPGKAWLALQPMLQDLLVRAGETLPPDLEAEVQAGRMTRDSALRVTRAEAQGQSLEQRQKREAERAEARAVQERLSGFVTAAETWETERRRADPNFDAKVPTIEREITWLHRTEGKPDTVEGIRDQLARAYKTANEQFRPAAPKVPARRPTAPVRGGQVNGSAAPALESTLDIIRAKTRGGTL